MIQIDTELLAIKNEHARWILHGIKHLSESRNGVIKSWQFVGLLPNLIPNNNNTDSDSTESLHHNLTLFFQNLTPQTMSSKCCSFDQCYSNDFSLLIS